MKPSDDLFILIKSLTKAERANFRKYAGRHVLDGKNKYLILFDAIDRQKKYDEAGLKNELSDTGFAGHIHVIKNYLLNLIIESLHSIKKHKFTESELYNDIVDCSILVDKGLHKTALKMIRKAKQKAITFEKEYLMFKLLDMETSIILYSDINRFTELEMGKIIREKRRAEETQRLKYELKHLFDRQNLLLKKRGSIRTDKDDNAMQEILSNKLLSLPSSDLTFESVYFKQAVKIKYYAAKGDMDKYAEAAEDLLDEFEQRKKVTALSYSMYFSIALHYLDYCVSYNKFSEFEKRMKEYDRLYGEIDPAKWEKRYLSEQIITHLGIMLKYCDKINNENMFNDTLAKIDNVTEEYKKVLPPRRVLSMSISFAEMSLHKKMYDSSLYWLNKVVNYPAHPAKNDVTESAALLNIMVQYETGNYEPMMYAINNARKMFRKKGRLLESEKAALGFFRKMAGITDLRKKIEEFELFKKKIENLSEMESEKMFYSVIRLNKWIELRLEELKPVHRI